MNIDSIINPVSRRPLLALPVILLGTLGPLYFGAIAPEVLSTWFPFTQALNAFVDAKLKHQTCPKSSSMSHSILVCLRIGGPEVSSLVHAQVVQELEEHLEL